MQRKRYPETAWWGGAGMQRDDGGTDPDCAPTARPPGGEEGEWRPPAVVRAIERAGCAPLEDGTAGSAGFDIPAAMGFKKSGSES